MGTLCTDKIHILSNSRYLICKTFLEFLTSKGSVAKAFRKLLAIGPSQSTHWISEQDMKQLNSTNVSKVLELNLQGFNLLYVNVEEDI